MLRITAITLLAMLCVSPLARAAAPEGGSPTETEAATLGGPFILMDQTGASVTDEDYHGSFLLLVFGYTNCPDLCPTTLMTLASAINVLGPEGKKIRPVFISLDPARDTAPRLKEYVGSFGPTFIGLTGPEAFIENVATKYHVRYSKSATSSGNYTIDHSTGIFLLGPDGQFIHRFPYDIAAIDLAVQVRDRMRQATQ